MEISNLFRVTLNSHDLAKGWRRAITGTIEGFRQARTRRSSYHAVRLLLLCYPVESIARFFQCWSAKGSVEQRLRLMKANWLEKCREVSLLRLNQTLGWKPESEIEDLAQLPIADFQPIEETKLLRQSLIQL